MDRVERICTRKNLQAISYVRQLMNNIWWPLAFIIFVFYYREKVADLLQETINLLRRIKKAGKGGLEFGHPAQPRTSAEESNVDELIRTFEDDAQLEQEEHIKKGLADKKITDDSDKIKILISHLAAIKISNHFQKIYLQIYGSQITILKALNSERDGISDEPISIKYNVVAEKHPEIYKNYSFELYMNFLISNELIIKKDNLYFLTKLGISFLAYLTKQGFSENLPY